MHDEQDNKRQKVMIAIGVLATLIFGYVIFFSGDANADEPQPCVPTPAIPAVPEIPGTPEIPAVTHEEQVFDHWQRYSWTGGPHTPDSAPAFPGPDWQSNVQGDPHGVGVEGAYYRSNGNSGNGDWFYLEAVEKTIVVIDTPAVPAVPGTPGTPEVPAVTCPEPPTDEPTTPTEEPSTPVTPTEQPTTGVETPEPPVVIVPEECPKPRDILFDIDGNIVGADADEVYVISGSCEDPQIDTPEDPVVDTETTSKQTKTVKVYTHESGKTTAVVRDYGQSEQLVEEGL